MKNSGQTNNTEISKFTEYLQYFQKAREATHRDDSAVLSELAAEVEDKAQEAIKCFDKVLKAEPKNKDAWYYKGIALVYLQKLKEAIDCFDKVLKIEPQHKDAWYDKGDIFGMLGKHKQAIECFTKVLTIDPSNTNTWGMKGEAFAHLGKNKEALECFDQVLKIDPTDKSNLNDKAAILTRMGKYEEAMKCCDEALKTDPKYKEAWATKGTVFSSLGEWEESVRCCQKALEIDPEYQVARINQAVVYNGRGIELINVGRYKEAIEFFDKAHEANPDDEWPVRNKQTAMLEAKQKGVSLPRGNQTEVLEFIDKHPSCKLSEIDEQLTGPQLMPLWQLNNELKSLQKDSLIEMEGKLSSFGVNKEIRLRISQKGKEFLASR